ncbi:MAG TPA: DUF72 domain-containing protein [Thermoprotei archaeon]|nr:DUF72 domain-containing protein [Thermoprotei archaeon]
MIKIGICGFSTSKRKIYSKLKLLEIQKSFYQPGQIETYIRWRNEAPKDFEFTVKAWQGLTHDIKSPTWRRFKGSLYGEPSNYGGLRLNNETRYAIKKSIEICRAVGSSKLVIQLPPKLEWREYMIDTLKYISQYGYTICLEPRNKSWFTGNVQEILRRLEIVFVTDPFKDGIIDLNNDLIYLRLHGIGGYRYRYTENDLKRLIQMVNKYIDRDIYILFNNVYMYEDALTLLNLVREA